MRNTHKHKIIISKIIIYKSKTSEGEKKPKPVIMRQNISKNPIEFICVGCLLLGLEPDIKYALYTQ